MSKLINYLMLLVLLLCTQPIFGQLKVGLLGGLNMSGIDIDSPGITETKNVNQLGAGLVLEYDLGENFSLRVEPMYLQKGAEIIQPGNPNITAEMDFIEIPFLLKYSFGGEISPYVIAGPAIGFLIKNELSLESADVSVAVNIDDVTEKLDAGLCLGAGLNIPVGPADFFFEARYTMGFSNVQKGGIIDQSVSGLPVYIDFEKERDAYSTYGLQIMVGATIQLNIF